MSTDQHERAREHLAQGVALRRRVSEVCVDDLVAAVDRVVASMRAGGKLMICGNGGSAADSQHLAAEFVGQLFKDRPRRGLPALALTTDSSCLTATANDHGYEHVFARQVEALGKPGDVLLGISTSGGSANVLRAMQEARQMEITTVALIGEGGAMEALADIAIRVPSRDTQLIQEQHLTLEHLLCELVERDLMVDAG